VDLGWLDYDTSPRLHLHSSRIIAKEVDAIVALCYSHLDGDFVSQLADLRDEIKKPIILVAGLPVMEKPGMTLLVRKGIPTYTILQRALKVLSAMVRYSNYRQQA
jgi:acyl-CoA synthetase (NDP forming)